MGTGGDTGARDALDHSRATSESTQGKVGKCQDWSPQRPVGGKPQDLAVDAAGFRHQLLPEEGLSPSLERLWGRRAAGLGAQSEPPHWPQAAPSRGVSSYYQLTWPWFPVAAQPLSPLSHPPLTRPQLALETTSDPAHLLPGLTRVAPIGPYLSQRAQAFLIPLHSTGLRALGSPSSRAKPPAPLVLPSAETPRMGGTRWTDLGRGPYLTAGRRQVGRQ